jgi:signal transduction histidine kinase/DNA-binding response OmpR family regulator
MAIRADAKDLLLSSDEAETLANLAHIEQSKVDVLDQIAVLRSQYLGSQRTIDSVQEAFVLWNTMRDDALRLLRMGRKDDAVRELKNTGRTAEQAEAVLAAVGRVDDFARRKGEELYTNSARVNRDVNVQSLSLVAFILLLSLGLTLLSLKNIRTPIADIVSASNRFHHGDRSARSEYMSRNEFGVLAASFNTLVGAVQENAELSEKSVALADSMLRRNDEGSFFRELLEALCASTASQIAVVYLLNDEKNRYDCFAAIGAGDRARRSFAMPCEGELGLAVSTRAIQRVSAPSGESAFAYAAVSGTILPKDIVTIPIVEDDEVIAVLSLASVAGYSETSMRLIQNTHAMISARVHGILAIRATRLFMDALHVANAELEAQKSELEAQTVELTEMNRELEQQKVQLDEASRLKSSFLSNMSHELRTPLNSVIALSGVLHRRMAQQMPEEERSYLEVIERNGKHLLAMINNVLDLARIEAGHDEVAMEVFDMNAVIANVVRMLPAHAVGGVVPITHADADRVLSVDSDSAKCRHILHNLLANAVKFTQQGSITVTARQRDGRVEVTVADTGIGIDAEHLPFIFDQFRQADGSTSRKYGGSGLGLSIAKNYATLLGGSLTARSTPGAGSEFTLTIPVKAAAGASAPGREATAIRPSAAPRPLRGGEGKTVLIVEDSDPAIVQIRDFLEEDGYRILLARDGREALDITANTTPDAIILDIMMPGIDGIQVLIALREAERTAGIPVLVLTAKQISREELSVLKRNNIHQLIQKGDVNREELRDAVAAMTIPEAPEPTPPSRPRIDGTPLLLLAEDNPDNMLTLRALLADTYALLEATDGRRCVDLAVERKPHLIIMDIDLPVMDGIEAFAAIRRQPQLAHIPVIALTASAMASDRSAILAHGFDAYLAKPVEESALLAAIGALLSR